MRTILGDAVVSIWAAGTQDRGLNRSWGNLFFEGQTIYSYGHHFVLGIRLDWGFLLNADVYSVTTSRHQAAVRSAAHATGRPYIAMPFSALQRAGIPMVNVVCVAMEGERTIERQCKRVNCWASREGAHTHATHLLGQAVIRCGGDYYLSGTDETGADPFSAYFLAQLPAPAHSVTEALHLLKPPAVHDAESAGVAVPRQGEWFFLPSGAAPTTRGTKGYLVNRMPSRPARHRATELVTVGEVTYVRGTIRHTGGEHKMLSLGKVWYTAHENMEVRSFRSGGRVD